MHKYFSLMNVKEDLREKASLGEVIPPGNLPFGADLEAQLKILEEVETVVEKMRVVGRKKLLPFQEGILMSCRSLPILHRNLQRMFPSEKIEILTTHLNQDVLEQFFALIRMAGRHIPNPTPIEFQRRLRRILLGKNPQILLNQATLNVTLDGTDDSCQILNLEVTRQCFIHMACNV